MAINDKPRALQEVCALEDGAVAATANPEENIAVNMAGKLLKHTPDSSPARTALMINPAKTCQPVGAMYAALGIHGCLPHSHGSQGCCSYHRTVLSRHYKEPVMAATSSFTEGASVFGGQSNLLSGLETIFSTYNPDLVAVHTTCLSETIGDDIKQISMKARDDGKIPAGKHVIYASTPSYVGSHVTGFANMTKSMVDYFAEKTGKSNGKVNIIPGWVEPADMREIKRVSKEMGIKTIMFPDTSDVLDGPLTGSFKMYPKGGVTVPELKSTGDSLATISLGPICSGPAAKLLDTKCKVPVHQLNLPIGLKATDKFIDQLRKVAGVSVPESITRERGVLIDLMADMHQYTYGRKVAIVGDPDQMVSLAEFLVSLDMIPVHVVTGSPGKKFIGRIEEVTKGLGRSINIAQASDMFQLHQWIRQEKVDLIIGNTYAKYIARDEDIPLVRFGFPILDRQGHQHQTTSCYTGAVNLLVKILDAIMTRIERDAPVHQFELAL